MASGRPKGGKNRTHTKEEKIKYVKMILDEGYSVWGVTDNGDSYRGYTPSYPNDVGIDSGGIVPAIVLEN